MPSESFRFAQLRAHQAIHDGRGADAAGAAAPLSAIADGKMLICATATERGGDNLHPLTEATATGYFIRFTDFIFQQANGDQADGLPVVEYRQNDATFFDVDFQARLLLAEWSTGSAYLTGLFDYVNAEVDAGGNDNLPRTPPSRYGLGIEARWGRVAC